jgi:hypothetical protein
MSFMAAATHGFSSDQYVDKLGAAAGEKSLFITVMAATW